MIGHRQEHRAVGATMAMALALGMLGMLTACDSGRKPLDVENLKEFAANYTSAWNSQDATKVAKFFAPTGSLKINEGAPAVGRVAIAAAVQKIMTDFPDMAVKMEELSLFKGETVYHWTLNGKNTGPGGTGKAVRITGYEEWTLDADGLIAKSLGHFDEQEYERQLKVGYKPFR